MNSFAFRRSYRRYIVNEIVGMALSLIIEAEAVYTP